MYRKIMKTHKKDYTLGVGGGEGEGRCLKKEIQQEKKNNKINKDSVVGEQQTPKMMGRMSDIYIYE